MPVRRHQPSGDRARVDSEHGGHGGRNEVAPRDRQGILISPMLRPAAGTSRAGPAGAGCDRFRSGVSEGDGPPRAWCRAATGPRAGECALRAARTGRAPEPQAWPGARSRTTRIRCRRRQMPAPPLCPRSRSSRQADGADPPPEGESRQCRGSRDPSTHGPSPAPAAPQGGEPPPSTPETCAALPCVVPAPMRARHPVLPVSTRGIRSIAPRRRKPRRGA